VENGYLKLVADGKSAEAARSGSIYFNPIYTNTSENKQPLVFEYKVKFDAASTMSTTAYFAHHANSSKSPYGIQLYPKKEKTATGAYLPKVNFTSDTANTYTLPGEITDWHTVSIVYSNVDNTKVLYWDGSEIATSTNATAANANYWDDQGKLGNARLYISTPANWAFTTYMDSMKLYEKPSAFGAQVLDSDETELDELYVDFNSTVSNINAGVLSINGKFPESITLTDEEKQIYKLTLSEKLKPQTEYKLSLNGVSNTVGQLAYNDVVFKTRALNGNEVYYDISGAGIVKAGEEEVKNGTFTEVDSHTLTVKPNKGYEAVVKVNGEAVEESAYATYNVAVTDGALVEISFTALAEEEAPSFISIPYIFTEGSTSYTFARINKALGSKNYGVIVSEDKAEPVIEDVNGETTFKFPAIRGTNKYGEFGIGIKDKAEGKLGNKYYVRPYAVSEGTYYYGTSVEVNK